MAAAAVRVEEAALQAVARATGWTYSLLWHLCPRQRALVWAEGHYNGAIRTRKTTVAPGGGSGGGDDGEEEAARRRSRELRELYGSLAGEAAAADGGGGDAAQQVGGVARRPGAAAALAPEDLTETEWLYLMCASYCFPPARGLPGEAFARRGHVWLCGANKVDSKVFSRAILARSAGIQTVACIPVDDGVLEIGTTENVEEDIGLVQYARSIFMDQLGTPIMPTLSGHSTSTPTTHINHPPFRMKMEKCILQPNNFDPEGECIEMEGDGDRINSETNTENDSCQHPPLDSEATPNAWSSEAMRIENSERVRDGCSNLVNGNLPGQDEAGPWHLLYEGLSSKYLQSSAAEDQAVLTENTHYIKTVLTILRYNMWRQTQEAAASNIRTYLPLSKNSSFSRWNPNKGTTNDLQRVLITDGTQQRMLKSIILFSAHTNNSHQKRRRGEAQPSLEPIRDDDGEGTSRRSRRGKAQAAELMSASHVVRERQRREKLNERFIVLRSLVPFVTKMDRASILGDTIEYVKQLRRRIQDLESRSRAGRLQIDDGNPTAAAAARALVSKEKRAHGAAIIAVETTTSRSKVMRAVEASSSSCSTSGSGGGGGGGGAGRPPEPAAEAASTEVQVSIIGSDALLELRCRRRDGLLLRVMQALHRELGMEVTAVQSSSAGDVLLVELRAKVKEVHGRRSSINEVKRRIHLIISSTD